MVYRCAVRYTGGWRVRISIDDFVAALFALADYGCYAAEDAFAFGLGRAFFGVAVEDFCLGGEAGF